MQLEVRHGGPAPLAFQPEAALLEQLLDYLLLSVLDGQGRAVVPARQRDAHADAEFDTALIRAAHGRTALLDLGQLGQQRVELGEFSPLPIALGQVQHADGGAAQGVGVPVLQSQGLLRIRIGPRPAYPGLRIAQPKIAHEHSHGRGVPLDGLKRRLNPVVRLWRGFQHADQRGQASAQLAEVIRIAQRGAVAALAVQRGPGHEDALPPDLCGLVRPPLGHELAKLRTGGDVAGNGRGSGRLGESASVSQKQDKAQCEDGRCGMAHDISSSWRTAFCGRTRTGAAGGRRLYVWLVDIRRNNDVKRRAHRGSAPGPRPPCGPFGATIRQRAVPASCRDGPLAFMMSPGRDREPATGHTRPPERGRGGCPEGAAQAPSGFPPSPRRNV